MINQPNAQLNSQEWVGLYKNMEDALLEWVNCSGYLKEYRLGHVQFSAEFMNTSPKSTVGSQYSPLPKLNQTLRMQLHLWLLRAR